MRYPYHCSDCLKDWRVGRAGTETFECVSGSVVREPSQPGDFRLFCELSRVLRTLMLACSVSCIGIPLTSAQVAPAHNELALTLGEGNPRVDMAGITYARTFGEWQTLSCRPLAEASAEDWRERGDSGHRDSLSTIGALAGCRFHLFNSDWFGAEIGLGARLLSKTSLDATESYSTAFQFQEILGLRARLDPKDRFFLNFRIRHISNADIKRPNPGVTGVLASLGFNF